MYYAVSKGREPGIYMSWTDCRLQTEGFPGAKFKKFKTMEEANAFLGIEVRGKPRVKQTFFKTEYVTKADITIFTDGCCINNGRGKNVTAGYCENVFDIQKKIVNKEILSTGDHGYMDSDGYVFLNGRSDRIVKVYGHRLNLADIEETLNANNIKSVAFSSNNLIRIYCVSCKLKKSLEKIIKNNFNINFNLFKIFKIDKIPLNKNMKIIYDEKKFISRIQ